MRIYFQWGGREGPSLARTWSHQDFVRVLDAHGVRYSVHRHDPAGVTRLDCGDDPRAAAAYAASLAVIPAEHREYYWTE